MSDEQEIIEQLQQAQERCKYLGLPAVANHIGKAVGLLQKLRSADRTTLDQELSKAMRKASQSSGHPNYPYWRKKRYDLTREVAKRRVLTDQEAYFCVEDRRAIAAAKEN